MTVESKRIRLEVIRALSDLVAEAIAIVGSINPAILAPIIQAELNTGSVQDNARRGQAKANARRMTKAARDAQNELNPHRWELAG